jgi:hypothetical protein
MVVLGHYHWNELAFLAVALVFIGAFALIELRVQAFAERRRSGRIAG